MEYPDEVVRAVAEQALPAWGLDGAALALISRSENVVFRVDAEDGRAFALRVHRPGYHSLAELESEPIWTAALHEAGISAPVAEQTRAGSHYAVVAVPGTEETRHVGLVPWFDGVPLRRHAPADLGRLHKRLGNRVVNILSKQAHAHVVALGNDRSELKPR